MFWKIILIIVLILFVVYSFMNGHIYFYTDSTKNQYGKNKCQNCPNGWQAIIDQTGTLACIAPQTYDGPCDAVSRFTYDKDEINSWINTCQNEWNNPCYKSKIHLVHTSPVHIETSKAIHVTTHPLVHPSMHPSMHTSTHV